MSIEIKPLDQAHPIAGAVCPRCQTGFQNGMNAWTCVTCGHHFPLRDGISLFAANPSYCPGAISYQWLQDLVRQSRKLGWDQAWWEASSGLCPEERATLEQAVGVEARESWQYLVSLSPDAVALDLGGGWGPLSCSLAEKVAQVYSIDPSLERLQLLRARAEQRGLDNLYYLQAGDELPLPFPDHFFDLVNVGGALEHIPCLIAGNPRQVQMRMLQEIRRIVKPTGQVYAGMENRFSRQSFQGKPQEASSTRYASLMPRLLAHLYCLLTRGRTYRSYTYSAAGTERLFHQAGFATVQTLLLDSDHRNFGRVLASSDLDQLAALYRPRSAWKRLGKRLLTKMGVLSRLAPAFGLVISPKPDGHHFLEQIVSRVSCNQQARYEIVETLLRDYGGCVLMLQNRDEPDRGAVLKLAFAERGEKSHGRATRNAVQMAETLKGATPRVPRILESGIAQGHTYVLEERLPGSNGWQMMASGWFQDRLADTVWDFLEGWMRSTRSTVRLSEADFSRWLPYQPKYWRHLAGPQTARALEELIPALRAYMVGREQVMVASHGDFSLGNILFHESTGAITGIVDWDSADTQGLPLLDAISLSQYREVPFFDLGFTDEFAAGHSVSALTQTLMRVSTCPGHVRLARTRSEYGYETDRDAYLALFLFFLKRHQPGSLALRKQTRKWVEAFRPLVKVI